MNHRLKSGMHILDYTGKEWCWMIRERNSLTGDYEEHVLPPWYDPREYAKLHFGSIERITIISWEQDQ